MEEPKKKINGLSEDALKSLQKEFVVIGKTHIKAWHAWLVLGVVAGIVGGVLFVANRSGEFSFGLAAGEEEEYEPTSSAVFVATETPELAGAKEKTEAILRLKGKVGIEALRERRTLLEKLIPENPAAALGLFLPDSVLEKFSAEARSEVEQRTVFEGQLEVLHVDDFQNRKSEFKYFLKKGSERLEFYPVGFSTESLVNSQVRVTGFRLGNKFIAAIAKNTVEVLRPAPQPESVGDQKTLVILVSFLDSTQPPFSRDKAHELVFSGDMQAFYKEASYGKVSFSGDVIGWLTLPRNLIADGYVMWPRLFWGGSDPDGIFSFISQSGLDLKNYGRLVFVINHHSLGGGMSSVGKWDTEFQGQIYRFSTAWVGHSGTSGFQGSMTNFDYILSHELGHSLGVMHANSWECGSGKILYGKNCQHDEYGNRFDVMGVGFNASHFNAFHKDFLQWFDNDILNITQSGTYTINPLEMPSGTKGARIYVPALGKTPYYLEYRRALGFDRLLESPEASSNQNGLFINWIRTSWMSFSRLLDMRPGSSADWDDWSKVALLGEEKFVDKGRGVTIGPIVSATEESITFKVKLSNPKCSQQAPSISWLWVKDQTIHYIAHSGTVGVYPGESFYFWVDVENISSPSCQPSEFEIGLDLPKNWGFIITQNKISLDPDGGIGVWSGEIQVPEDAVIGNEHPFKFTFTNLAKKALKVTRGAKFQVVFH